MRKATITIVLLITFFYGCNDKNKSTNIELENFRSITTADLDTIQFRMFNSEKTVILQEYDWFNGIGRGLGDTFNISEASYYPVIQIDNRELMLINRQTPNGTIYYIGDSNFKDSIQTIYVYPVSPVQNKYGGIQYYDFEITPSGEPEKTALHINVRKEFKREDEYTLTRYTYNFGANGIKIRDLREHYALKDELTPHDFYRDISLDEKPKPILTTDEFETLDYISLDSLFKVWPLESYTNETPDVSFYIFPQYYEKQYMVLERTRKINEGHDRYRLRRFDYNKDWFDEKMDIDVSPRSKQRYTGNGIERQIEFFPANIVLVYEKEITPDATTKSIYSWYPDTDLKKPYQRGERYAHLAGFENSYFNDREEVKVVINFLQWYAENCSRIYQVPFFVDLPGDTEPTYTIDMAACDQLADILRESGAVSEKHIAHYYEFYSDLKESVDNDEETGDITDWYLHDIEIEHYLKYIKNGYIAAIEACRIIPGRSVVTVTLGDINYYLTFNLSKIDGKWLIDSSNYRDWQDYIVTGMSGALLLPATRKQVERMLEHYELEHEDKYYYEDLEYIVSTLKQENINPQIISDEYEYICFPDGSYMSKDSIYLYDVLLFEYGKKPRVIPQANIANPWNDPKVHYIEVDLRR